MSKVAAHKKIRDSALSTAGRPSAYSDEIADYICTQLGDGLSLRRICKQEGIPPLGTVMRWLSDEKNSRFREQYSRSKLEQAELLADEIVDIADDSASDTYIDDNGNERTNHEAINRSRLRVDARKWFVSKLLPKKYGDKLETTHSGTIEIAAITRKIIDSRPALGNNCDED